MTRCNGKGYAQCDTCINREHDPLECDSCKDADKYEPETTADDADDYEEIDFTIWLQREDFA